MFTINKDTKIYGSFSKNAGNRGCEFFNAAFQKYKINAIYKSFSIEQLLPALSSARMLGFSGCAVAMPFKKEAVQYLDKLDDSVKRCGSTNTILFTDGEMVGYNTDYYATEFLLKPHLRKFDMLYILGNGGLAGAVVAKAMDIGFNIKYITRKNWNDINQLKNSLIFNCTPLTNVVDPSNVYIDCLIGTQTGNEFNLYQAAKQFEIYTCIIYDL